MKVGAKKNFELDDNYELQKQNAPGSADSNRTRSTRIFGGKQILGVGLNCVLASSIVRQNDSA